MSRNVLFVTTPPYIGGAEISLMTLMQNLRAEQYQPRLLTSKKGQLFEQVERLNIPVFAQPFPWFSRKRPWQYLHSIYRLAKIIRGHRIELIHTNCDHSLRYVMYASYLTGVPYVSHVRDLVRTWFKPEKVSALNKARRVVANSEATANACKSAGIKQVTTIYNPIDLASFTGVEEQAVRRLRSELQIPKDNVVVGIVGQIQPIKGHEEFIAAGLQLVSQAPNVSVAVVGAVPPGDDNRAFSDRLHQKIDASGYADRFHFTGFRDDIPVVMNMLDILAVPSWAEPFGRVAVEGMAAGCAVIGTNAGGLPEIINHETDGLLVPPKNETALATALQILVTEPALRKRLVAGAGETAQKFAVTNHVDQMQQLFSAVLSLN